MQALKMNIGGIKCDNKECNFNDMTVLFEDYDQWLNKPCPKCGSNLLTQQDYDSTILLVELATSLNEMFPEPEGEVELFKMSANFDGTGEILFSEIKPLKAPEQDWPKAYNHPADIKF